MAIIDKIMGRLTDEEGIFRGGEEGRPLGRARDIIFGESRARTEELETGSTRVPSDQLPEDYYGGSTLAPPLTGEEKMMSSMKAYWEDLNTGSTPVPPEDLLPVSRYADPSMDPGTIRDEDVFNKLPGEADLFDDPTLMRNEPGRVAAREEADWEGTGMSQDEFAENLLLTIAGGGAAGYGLKKLLQYGGREGAKTVQRAVARRKMAQYMKEYKEMQRAKDILNRKRVAPPGAYRPPVEAKGVEALASPIDKYLKMLPPEKAAIWRKALESPSLIGMTKKSARY